MKSATDYLEVRYRVTGTQKWSVPRRYAPSGSIGIPGLQANTAYDFEVRAGSNCGAVSAWVPSGYTLPDLPAGTIRLDDLSSAAATAQAAANAANDELAAIAADNVLSPSEKPIPIRDYSVILTEHAGIDAQADAYGVSRTAYDNAVSALSAYLAGLTAPVAWNDISGNTTIDGPTFRGKFADVYSARQALLNSIYAAAKALANNAQSTANNANTTAGTAQNTANNAIVTAQNLNIVNLSMAQGMLGWSAVPSSEASTWYAQTGASGPGGATTYIVHAVDGVVSTLSNTRMPCLPGQVIKASGQCLGFGSPNGAAAMYMAFYNSSGGQISAPNSNQVSGNGFHQLSMTATAPAGAAFVTIGPSGGPASGAPTGYYSFANFTWNYQPSSIDEVPDGVDYARRAAVTGTGGDIELDNAQFTLGSGNAFTGWTQTQGDLVYDSGSTSYLGTRCMSFRATAGVGGSAAAAQMNRKIAITPGDVLTITALLYSPSGGYQFANVVFYTAAGAVVGTALQAASTSPAWAYVSATATVPATVAYGVVSAGLVNPASGSLFGSVGLIRVHTNDLRVAGSGATIGDQRNLLPVTWASVQSSTSNAPLSYSISGTTVTIACAATTIYAGSASVAYNASSVNVTQNAGTTATYYAYYIDTHAAGGSQALNVTTDYTRLARNDGVVALGSVSVTVASGGGGTGGGGGGTAGGGGGGCVRDTMLVAHGMPAGAAQPGDVFDCVDLPGQIGKHQRKLLAVEHSVQPCVRLVTDRGAILECSESTPFDTPDGKTFLAPKMVGEQVVTDRGVETVMTVAKIGDWPVAHCFLGGVSYAAGVDPHHRIYSHNVLIK